MGLLISRIVLTAIFVYLTFLVWTNNMDIWGWVQNQAKSILPITKNKVPVEHSIKKIFEVNVSLTEFSKANADWASTDSLCCATFNIMNVGDFPFTIQDFFITASLDEDGTKSVHRALNENGKKLNPVVVNPARSSAVKVYFDVRKAIYAVPDKIGKQLDLYSDIVIEAIARDGLRENLIFKNNTLKTEVFELDKNYFHKLLHVMSPYRTSAIRFLGNHATGGSGKKHQEDANTMPVKMMQPPAVDDNHQSTQKKPSAFDEHGKTQLYARTKRRIDDLYNKIYNEKLKPWQFLNAGKPLRVEKQDGTLIQYEGVGFEGSPRTVFWGANFIPPIIENAIETAFDQTIEVCQKSDLTPKPYIDETSNFLAGLIARVYSRMADMDQKLRGKGFPEKIERRDVKYEINKMNRHLKEHYDAAILLASKKTNASKPE